MILTMLAALALLQDAAPPAAVTPGTVAVQQPAAQARGRSPDVPFAEAVESALGDAGFTSIPGVNHARYVATIEVTRHGRGAVRSSAPSSGPNAGAGTLGAALGGAVSVPLGGGGRSQLGELVSTELFVTLTRRGESTPAWEGRAITQQIAGTRGGDPATVARKLASALFRNFPQASGLTMSVP